MAVSANDITKTIGYAMHTMTNTRPTIPAKNAPYMFPPNAAKEGRDAPPC